MVKELMNLQEIHYSTFGVKVIQHLAPFLLHYVIYAPAKFAVASANGLGEDAFTRNVMDGPMHGRTYGQTDDGQTWQESNILFFSEEKKAGIINRFDID